MSRSKTPRVSARGVMKNGCVEILDDVEIADGSLLDIIVVETSEESEFKAAKKKRRGKIDQPIQFGFRKNQLTSDPLKLLARIPKSGVGDVRFDGYRVTCHVVLSEWQCAFAQYALSLHPPPEEIAKLFSPRNPSTLAFGTDSKFNRCDQVCRPDPGTC